MDVSVWHLPRRRHDGRVLAGVAGGIAAEIGLDPLVVRVAFVVLAAAGGWGVVLYAVAWTVMAANERGAGDPSPPVPKGRTPTTRLVAFGMIVSGLLLLARALDTGFVDSIVWPLALLGVGVALSLHRGLDFDRLVGERSDGLVVRLVAGVLLVVAGIVLAISLNFDLRAARDTVLVVGLVLAGAGLVLAPQGVRLLEDLAEERRRRIRSEARAEMAAHLHDSVLQTLSLIQRRATDPEVVGLAHGQERELRSWLFGGREPRGDSGLRHRLDALAADVERIHKVPVEVVAVGDAPVNVEIEALLGATREAVTNAARHAGAGRIDVFAEVSPGAIDVFVRDQGKGFDPEVVPADRRGVQESIIGRLQRAGGRAAVLSAPGEGTEVELHLERSS